jgi:hypothetical protein
VPFARSILSDITGPKAADQHEQRYRSNANGWQADFPPPRFWTAVAERSGDTAFATEATSKSGVALRFPPQSKTVHRL